MRFESASFVTIHGTALVEWAEGGGLFAPGEGGGEVAEAAGGGAHDYYFFGEKKVLIDTVPIWFRNILVIKSKLFMGEI